jgi:hypothetical protein
MQGKLLPRLGEVGSSILELAADYGRMTDPEVNGGPPNFRIADHPSGISVSLQVEHKHRTGHRIF